MVKVQEEAKEAKEVQELKEVKVKVKEDKREIK